MTPTEWEAVQGEYRDKVMGYIAARAPRGTDAEDLCEDVFEKVWRNIDTYRRDKASLGTWIYTITRNTVIDCLRRTRPAAELDEDLASDLSVEQGFLERETLEELAAALRELPQDLRDIVVLVYYEGLPMTQVARTMHLSYGAVRIRHRKALDLLKRSMDL